MRDYPCERFARDARITTIYEGTSQLQVVAAVRGVCGGTLEKYLTELIAKEYCPDMKEPLALLAEGTEEIKKAIAFVKKAGVDYMDLYGRALVDIAISLINGYLFIGQASSKVDLQVTVADNGDTEAAKTMSMAERKKLVATMYITKEASKIKALAQKVLTGDKSTFKQYEALIGPVPEDL